MTTTYTSTRTTATQAVSTSSSSSSSSFDTTHATDASLAKSQSVAAQLKYRYYRLYDGLQYLPNASVINWKKGGVLNQLANISSNYIEWIDHPAKNNIQIRMFDSDFLEACSFTKWWVVPLFYIPWALLELFAGCYRFSERPTESSQVMLALANGNDSVLVLLTVAVFLFGVQGWTIFEYFVHRFLFHLKPADQESTPLLVVHFLGHGLHHVTPTDPYRLVFPPAISVPLGIVFRWFFYTFLFPFGMSDAYFGGFMLGYACYESVHYLCHHCTQDAHPWIHAVLGHYLANRNKYHSQHHYSPAKQDKLYGVTSQMWDVVFGTM